VPLSLGLGLALISSYSNVLSGKRSQLGSWSQTMALDTATQPTGGTDLSHYAEATAIDAAAPSTAPPDFHPGVAHSRAPPAPLQPYHRSPGHLTPAHYTTLGTGPTFRDRDLCSTRLPHLRVGLHFQRPSAGPMRTYPCAFFASYVVSLRGAMLALSAVDDSPVSEALPSSMINAVVAPLRRGLLLITSDSPAWTPDAHLLCALLSTLHRATLPNSGAQHEYHLPFSSAPPSPAATAAASLCGGISIVASDAQLRVLRALLRASPCTSQAVLLSAASAALLAPLREPFVHSTSREPSDNTVPCDVFAHRAFAWSALSTFSSMFRDPSTDNTADADEPAWLREAGELVAALAPSAAAVCSVPPTHHRLSGLTAEFADAPPWLLDADAQLYIQNAQLCGTRLALSSPGSSPRLDDSRLHVSTSMPSMIVVAAAPPRGSILPLNFRLRLASLGARRPSMCRTVLRAPPPATVAYTPCRPPIFISFAVHACGTLVVTFIETTSSPVVVQPLRTSLVASSSSPPLHRLRSFSTRCPLRLAGGGDREDSLSLPCL